MITEDYVSFETAKLLKEKGFDGECDYLYVNGNIVRAQGCACNWNKGETLFADYKNECSAPTLQMVMKWLREVHKIYMYVARDSMENAWWARVYRDYEILSDGDNHSTYEEACEDGIKYCLKNLFE